MKKRSLSVIGKIFTSVILTCYSFAPSVMAIDDIISTDNSQDILETGVSDPIWITNGNSSTTFNVVTVGETYVAPQNSEVTVTFSKLPSNPSTLSITEITLTDEEVAATRAVSNKAYDINTDMVDGTFEYDLTLSSSSDNTKVVYAENRNELLNNVQEVNNTVVDQGDTVKVEDLDHFTLFILVSADDTEANNSVGTPDKGWVSDNQYATFNSGSDYAEYSFPDIAIPSYATITGIEVLLEGKTSGRNFDVSLWNQSNNTPEAYSSIKTTSLASTDTTVSLGGASDLWGETWTTGDFNTSFKVKVDATNNSGSSTASLDALQVKVHYSTPIIPTLIDNPLDKYAMTSVTGIWTSITGGSGYNGLNSNEIRWGTPADGVTKSGLTFTNSGAQSFNEGNTFYLGMLTHMNWGTQGGTAATGATLQITLDFSRPDIANQVLTYNFAIEETSNGYFCPEYQVSDTPCDDKVTFPNSYGTQVFTIDDVQYTLVIDGFVNEYPGGSAVSAFITEEQKNNSAFLVGHLSSVLVERPAISIIKKTNNQDIAVAPGSNLYVGDTVTWQYIVQNTGNTILNNITVTDNPVETITCPSTSLASGASMTCTASGTVMAGQFTNTATVRSGTLSASDSSYYYGAFSCGDNIKNGTEECDGTDGLPNSEFQCTNKCKLELVESKVTVCHASDSQSNPYVTNQPDKSADVSGHDGHNGPIWYSGITTAWGDIIPPFSYIGGHYDGKNWTTEGQAIWNNGCSVPKGTLIVQKTTLPSADSTIFDITASGTGTIFNGASGTISDSQDYTYSVAPGTYSVTESVPAGWGQTSNTCSNIAVAKGETKYCTIENKKLPVLTVNKVLNGESVSLDTFSFVLDGWKTTNFELDGSNDMYMVPNTTYTITETNPGSKYNVTYSGDCTGTLDYNETATCTITNTEYASLTIVKQANPHSSQSFGFNTSGSGLTNFSLVDDGSIFGSNTRTFINLFPGTYSVTEVADSFHDWYLAGVVCTNDEDNTSINIEAGDDITCTFSNELEGVIGGHKYQDLDGDIATTTDIRGVTGWTIELWQDGILKNQDITDLNGYYEFTGLRAGNYKLREGLVVGGWYKIYPTSEYIDVTLHPGDRDLTYNFVNVTYPAVEINKSVNIDSIEEPGGIFTFTLDIHNTSEGPVTITSLTDDNTLSPECNALIGTSLVADASISCSYTVGHTAIGTYENESTVTVTDHNGYTASDNDSETVWVTDAQPIAEVTKVANYSSVPEIGQNVIFTFTVENKGSEPVVITYLADSVLGILAGDTDCTVGTILPAGGLCSFTADYFLSGDYAGASHENIFTTKVTDDDNNEITKTDNEIISFLDVQPTIEITKTVDYDSMDEPGGTFTFTLNIHNTSGEQVIISALADTNILSSDCNSLIGTALTADASTSCTYTVNHIEAGSYDNTATVTVIDNDGSSASSSAAKTVSVGNVNPTIEVTKAASTYAVNEPGSDVTFTFTIRNTSGFETVTIQSLSDSIFGTLAGDADCAVGTQLIAGTSCEFSITRNISGDSLDTDHSNTFTAIANDNEGSSATDSQTINISFEDVIPSVEITKTVNVDTMNEPGGTFIFTLDIHNTSPEQVTITTLTDDNPLSSECLALIGTSLEADASTSCTYTVNHTEAGYYNNTANITVRDNEGNSVSNRDDKSVEIVNVNPVITVTKSANDTSVPETGQKVTFTFTVINNSVEQVTITSLKDSIFSLTGDSDCQIGTDIPAGGSCSFTQTELITGSTSLGNHVNEFTAKVLDNEEKEATASDSETIFLENVNPDITVTKTASVESIPETGGDVLFTFTVQNNTAESVMITDLVDDKFGDLAGDSDCYEGAVLSGNSSCSFAQEFPIPAGVAPAIHTNTFTATVIDDERNTDSDSASANVSLTYVPTLKLIKEVENAYNSDGSASDWTLYATGDENGFSVAGDKGTFHVVTPGQTYTLSERGLSGFTASQWSCDKEGVLDGDTVTLAAEDDVTCTITNTAQPGTITVYKDVVDSDYVGEGIYSDTTFNVTLNGDLTNVKAISDTEINPQVAKFNFLNADYYSIDELQTDGFISLGCIPQVLDDRRISLLEDGSFYVGNGDNIEVVCTNQVITPTLQIAKANNAGGASLVAGSNVLYTLIVTAPELQDDGGNYIIENVKVVDLPPAGIKYQPGSWTAVSSVRGNLKGIVTTEPTYASPGKWNLGKMLEGEVVTLTYVGNISDTLDAGKYKDLAWTEGVSLTDNRTLGKAATGFFASTNVNITEPVEEGQVLGITDEQTLPDTGASTILTIGAICTMLLGFVFLIFNPKKKMSKVLGLSIVAVAGIASLAMPTSAYAESGDLAVQIEQPKTPYSESTFKVGFVALDIQSRSITVQCYETTHGAFGPEYTLNTIGNSGNCEVDNSVVTSDGTYEFYVVAKAGTDEVISDKVSVGIDLVGPSPVLNYTKTTASCTNNLEFTTANDGQTTKVQIFRSNVATFKADSSTLIKEIVAGPNQLVTYSDTQPVCGSTYFYAIRAVDIAENTSSFVTDKTVVITIVPATTPTTPVTPTVVPTEEVKGTETTEESTDNTNTNQNTNEEVKGVTDEETETTVWSWLKYVLIGVGAVTIISVSYVYAKNRNRGNEIK